MLLIVAIVLSSAMTVYAADKDSEARSREYQIKAGYLYNFFVFVDWPKGKSLESVESVKIGIICLDPKMEYKKTYERLTQKKVNGKPIKVQFFQNINPVINPNQDTEDQRQALIEAFKGCHMLQICSCNNGNMDEISIIFNLLKECGVLTVGECPGFIEKGGNVNFITEGNKIRFEINLDAVKDNNLSIRAKLLKLAKRVISKKSQSDKG